MVGGIGIVEAEEEQGPCVVKGKHTAGDDADKQTQPAEERFAEAESGEGEHLRLDQPEHRPTDAVKFERHRGDQQHGSDGGEHHEGLAAARAHAEGQRHFNCAQRHQRPEGPFRMGGLIFQQAEHAD